MLRKAVLTAAVAAATLVVILEVRYRLGYSQLPSKGALPPFEVALKERLEAFERGELDLPDGVREALNEMIATQPELLEMLPWLELRNSDLDNADSAPGAVGPSGDEPDTRGSTSDISRALLDADDVHRAGTDRGYKSGPDIKEPRRPKDNDPS